MGLLKGRRKEEINFARDWIQENKDLQDQKTADKEERKKGG